MLRWGILYPRIQQCRQNNGGHKPNFIALDWTTQSADAKKIRDYLNFGGRLGTGQVCEDDSHCATDDCNIALGLCQCHECPSDSTDTCLGCDSEQICSSVGELELNICRDKVSSTQVSPTQPPLQPATMPVKTPQTDSPTKHPTEKESPSSFCGTDFFETVANCKNAVECSDDALCKMFGEDYTCWNGIVCDDNVTDDLSLTQKPTQTPSLGPTKTPFDFNNTFFCGVNYTDADENCYHNLPCPSGDPAVCGDGSSCFGGIQCVAPPSKPPTVSPTTKLPTTPMPPDSSGWSDTETRPPFNLAEFQSPTSAGVAISSSQWTCILAVIGLVGLYIRT